MQITIVNRRPGMIRGGRQHPPVQSYNAAEAVAAFTPEQLADIAGEAEMTLVVGDAVDPAAAAELHAALSAEAEAAPAAAEAAKKTKKANA